MELCSVATEGVSLCGDSTRVGDRAFRNLIQVTMDILLMKKNEESLKSQYLYYLLFFNVDTTS